LISEGSGSDAVGASAVVTTSGTQQYQQLIANNGTAQSEKILHFGLGKEKLAKKIVITWPSKKITTLENVTAGFHAVQEAGGLLSSVQ
jgi:enediyne biosynthesis protein E4